MTSFLQALFTQAGSQWLFRPEKLEVLSFSFTVCTLMHMCVISHVRVFATSWTAAHQASLSITNSWSLLKLTSIELAMPSNHLILCHPLLLLPSIFPSIRVFYPYALKVPFALANLHLSLFHPTLDPGRMSLLEYFRVSLLSLCDFSQQEVGMGAEKASSWPDE